MPRETYVEGYGVDIHLRKDMSRISNLMIRNCDRVLGFLRGNLIHAYWWNGNMNFGDLLTQEILRHYGFTPVFSHPAKSQVCMVGSILQHLPENYNGYIIGSGLIQGKPHPLKNARILALRGTKTKELVEAKGNILLGDPGILADRLIDRQTKRTLIGVVPHYKDQDNPKIISLQHQFPGKITIINALQQPQSVIKEIDKCEYILSSSLHGLVTADSLGIPSAWIVLSNKVEGDGFKFLDYSSSFPDKELSPVFLTEETDSINSILAMTKKPSKETEIKKEQFDYLIKQFRENLLIDPIEISNHI